MQLRIDQRFTCDTEQLHALLLDPAFTTARAEAEGARDIQVSLQPEADGVTLTVRREVPAQLEGELPALLRRFVRDWYRGEQSEHWRGLAGGTYQGQIRIAVEGLPVRIEGELEVRAYGQGSQLRGELRVHSPLPLVGNRLAELVGSDVQRKIAQQAAFTRQWLNVRRPLPA